MSRLAALTIEQTARHSMALVTKERQTVYKDEYGNTIFEAMDREVDRFIKSTVLRKAVPGDYAKALSAFEVKEALQGLVYNRLYDVHIPYEDEKDADAPLAIPDDHKAFEHWCAQTLEHQGWEARVLGEAGDQGADVIGTKDGIKLVVQCKRWAAPVTNRAVQEVAAVAYTTGPIRLWWYQSAASRHRRDSSPVRTTYFSSTRSPSQTVRKFSISPRGRPLAPEVHHA